VPSFRTGVVTRVLEERPGLQRVLVDLGNQAPERAYALTDVTGDVAVGDEVVLNTTAVELDLGTGGWHVVHWNLSKREFTRPGGGHIMKLRYTSVQVDAGAAEEHHAGLADVRSIDGMPVVVCALHSQMAAVAAGVRAARPRARVAYVMTDGGALPIVLSDLVATLRDRELLDATITAGHAFGGDHEAVTVHSALAVARHVVGADVAIVAIGPGIVGTASRLGHTGLEVGAALDAAAALGGVPIAALRASEADPRHRHRGLSHHSISALTVATRARVTVVLPRVEGRVDADLARAIERSGIADRHEVQVVDATDPLVLLDRFGIAVSSMGRPASDERLLFACATAAGELAGRRVPLP
jgi:Protein of unknown function (DUF3866)